MISLEDFFLTFVPFLGIAPEGCDFDLRPEALLLLSKVGKISFGFPRIDKSSCETSFMHPHGKSFLLLNQ